MLNRAEKLLEKEKEKENYKENRGNYETLIFWKDMLQKLECW